MNQKEMESSVWFELHDAYKDGQEGIENLIYSYRENRHKMVALVNHLVGIPELEDRFAECDQYSDEMMRLSTRKLYSESLTQLLMSKKIMTLKGQGVTHFHVIEKMLPHIRFDEFSVDSIILHTVVNCTIVDFIKANKETEIKNPVGYMKSCIWSTLQEGIVKSEMNYQYMFG